MSFSIIGGYDLPMDFETTRLWMFIFAAIFVASTILQRFAKPLTRLAWVPWTALMFTSLVITIVLAAHLFSEWRGVPLEPLRRR